MLWCHIIVFPLHQNLKQKINCRFCVFELAAEPGFLFFVAAAGVRTKGTEEGSAHTSGNEARSRADAEKTVSSACMSGVIIEMDTLGFEPRAFRMRTDVMPLHHVPHDAMVPHYGSSSCIKIWNKNRLSFLCFWACCRAFFFFVCRGVFCLDVSI